MIACLSVPYFAAAVERRADEALTATPLVVGGKPWEPRPVYAFSQEVAQQGVQPGMSLRLAHVLSPHSHFMPATPSLYGTAAGEVVDILTDFTHLIEPEALWQPDHGQKAPAEGRCLPARYALDLEKLPQKEALPLSQEMGRAVRRYTHLEPAVGLASNRFVAQVAAALAHPNHVRPVPPGDEAAFLASRPLDFLPLEKEMARRLQLLGIRTLGQLAALPAHTLQAQFGPEAVALHQLARGEAAAHSLATSSVKPSAQPAEQVARHFEPPLATHPPLQAALAQVATLLAGRLQERGYESGELQLEWELEDGAGRKQRQTLTLRQPTADPERLARTLQEMLRRQAPAAPVAALAVRAGQLTPSTVQQLSLFSARAPVRRLEEVVRRALARHRNARFYRPVLTDRTHPLPEKRFELRAFLPA